MPKPFLRRFTKKFFIICNLIVAVLFLFGASVQYFNPQRWWFMGLFALSLPYILLTLLLFFLFWLFLKKIWLLISVVTVAFCWKAVKNIFPLNFSDEFKIEKKHGNIRVMSWNVELFDILEHKTHPETKQKMIELVKQYQPDIACFQEMVGGDDSKAINYLGDLKREMGFSEYYYSYETKLDFDRMHHFGIITFSKFPIVKKKTISIAPYDYNSTFQFVDIAIGQDTVRQFNIHLQSLRFSQNNREYISKPNIKNTDSVLSESKSIIGKLKRGFLRRAIQADLLRSEINKSNYPVIVCGDLNDVPNSYAYAKISEGLQNAFVMKGTGFGRTFSSISPTLRIDNIFVDKIFRVDQFIRINQKLSDHFPIIADVAF